MTPTTVFRQVQLDKNYTKREYPTLNELKSGVFYKQQLTFSEEWNKGYRYRDIHKFRAIFYNKRSGRRKRVLSNDCWKRQSEILASWPERRISGTAHPSKSAGRV